MSGCSRKHKAELCHSERHSLLISLICLWCLMNWQLTEKMAGRRAGGHSTAIINHTHCWTTLIFHGAIVKRDGCHASGLKRCKNLHLLSYSSSEVNLCGFSFKILPLLFFFKQKWKVKHWQWSIQYDSISYIDHSPNNLSSSHYSRPSPQSLPEALDRTPERQSLSWTKCSVWQPVDNCLILYRLWDRRIFWSKLPPTCNKCILSLFSNRSVTFGRV